MRYALAVVIALVSAAAEAHDDDVIAACKRDAVHWCSRSDDLEACMRAHEQRLSANCRAVLRAKGYR